MRTNKQINELLNRKMDRKDFLKHLGVGTAAFFGLGTALKTISSFSGQEQKTQKHTVTKTATSYGGGPYGGRRPS